MTTQVFATRLNGDERMAMVETVFLTAVALIGLALVQRQDRGPATGGAGRKGTAPRGRAPGGRGGQAALTALCWLLALLLLLPHLTLLLLSFVPAGTWTVETLPPAYTTRNYLALISEPERLRPLMNSLWMAAAATAGAVALALLAAGLTARRPSRAGRAVQGLMVLPWAVPGTVFAIALATTFGVHRPWAGRVVLIGTLWLLPLAYLIRNLPIAGRAILAGARALDPSLPEAAASLGAGRWRTLRRVTLPLLRPAIAAGATLAFATAVGDFVTSIVLYTYDTRPLALEILASLRSSDVGVAAAYGVFLMVISGLVFALGGERETVTT